MASKTEIANLACSHLGIGVEIADLDTESSAEAMACRRFYEQSRQQTLRDFPWPSATKTVSLGLVENNPTTEWECSYTYPSDCLFFRRVLSAYRQDTKQTEVPYRIIRGASSRVIYTDESNAVAEYTVDETDEGRFSPDLAMAISLRLAAYIAPRVTAGDPFKLGDRAMQMYRFELAQARQNAFNEEGHEENPDSEFISGRS